MFGEYDMRKEYTSNYDALIWRAKDQNPLLSDRKLALKIVNDNKIKISIGNVCNYKCWYCWPGSNEGTFKWPDFDLMVNHISHVLNYYIEHTDKRKFDFKPKF